MTCVVCGGPLTGRQRKYDKPECARQPKTRKSEAAAHGRGLGNRFGITHDDYLAILAYQGGGCALCGRPESPYRRHAVDHDHATGVIRGVLCLRCNRYVVGNLTLEQVSAAHEYLTNPPAVAALGREAIAPDRPRKRRTRRKTRAGKL